MPGHIAIVALGSNLGDSAGTVLAAMEELKGAGKTGTFLRSSLWRSTPVDCPPGSPDFVNAVVAFETSIDETADTLLAKLHKLELGFGRTRTTQPNAARTLDLDLISFGNERRSSGQITLPHPRAAQRRFVLAPLSEILPHFTAPGWKDSAQVMLSELPADESVRQIPEH